MPFVIGFLVAFSLLIVYLAVQVKKAGPLQVGEMQLARAALVREATAAAPGEGWSILGSKTTANGLHLRFDHDDDPEAEATLLADPRRPEKSSTLAHRLSVRLGDEFETHHVHTRGFAFRVRMRGTGPVVGKEVRIQMHVRGDGTPWGGTIENDDDTDAAVGGWIEVESAELLEVGAHG